MPVDHAAAPGISKIPDRVKLRPGGNQHTCATELQQVRDRNPRQRRVDRLGDADRLCREDRGQQRAGIGREQPHRVAAADAEPGEHVRERGDLSGEIR